MAVSIKEFFQQKGYYEIRLRVLAGWVQICAEKWWENLQ